MTPAARDALAARQAPRHRGAIAAPAAGLAAIIAAAFAGAAFVSSEQAGASMAMAVLTGVALLCYLANPLMVGPAGVAGPAAENRLATEVGRAAEIKE